MENRQIVSGTKAFFLDKENHVIRCEIEVRNNLTLENVMPRHISIYCYDKNQPVGYLKMFDNPNGSQFFLDIVYVYSQFRGKLIGQKMLDLVPMFINNSGKKKVVGIYAPGNYSSDPMKDFDEYYGTIITEQFYNKNGFEIVNISDYSKEPQNFPLLEYDDFKCGNCMFNDLVYSKIPLKNSNNYIFYKDMLVHINDQDFFCPHEYEFEE